MARVVKESKRRKKRCLVSTLPRYVRSETKFSVPTVAAKPNGLSEEGKKIVVVTGSATALLPPAVLWRVIGGALWSLDTTQCVEESRRGKKKKKKKKVDDGRRRRRRGKNCPCGEKFVPIRSNSQKPNPFYSEVNARLGES